MVVFVGAVIAAVRFVAGGLRTRNAEVFVPVRLGLGRFLELGLGFQLASDVLRTAIAPSFRRDRAARCGPHHLNRAELLPRPGHP